MTLQVAQKLEAEALEVRKLGAEANISMAAAKRELSEAKDAILERRRAYDDCKLSRRQPRVWILSCSLVECSLVEEGGVREWLR